MDINPNNFVRRWIPVEEPARPAETINVSELLAQLNPGAIPFVPFVIPHRPVTPPLDAPHHEFMEN